MLQRLWNAFERQMALENTVDALETPETNSCTELISYIDKTLKVVEQVKNAKLICKNSKKWICWYIFTCSGINYQHNIYT